METYAPNEETRLNPRRTKLIEVETSDLPNKEFKVMIIKMLNKLKRMNKYRRSLTKIRNQISKRS